MSNIYIQEPPTNGKVLLKTTVGDVDIELWSKEAPKSCRNFVQLCLEGYYDGTAFHRVVKDFIVQGGDPTDTGEGGESIYGAPFKDEFHSRLRFVRRGLVAMANAGPHDNGSQFFFTMAATPELQNKHTIFGKVVGDTLFNMLKLQEVDVNEASERPQEPHRIISTEVLNNPFDDIVPRQIKRVKKEKDEEKKIKSKSKATKNFSLLSFGDEAEDDEEQVDKATESFRGKSKSSHDLTDDPRLSSVPAFDKEQPEEEQRKKKTEGSPEEGKSKKPEGGEEEAIVKPEPSEAEDKSKLEPPDAEGKKRKSDTKEEEKKRRPDVPDSVEKKSPLDKKSPVDKKSPLDKKSPVDKRSPIEKKSPVDKKSPSEKKSPVREETEGKKKKPEAEEETKKSNKEEAKEEERKKKTGVEVAPDSRKRKQEDIAKDDKKKRSRGSEADERKKRKGENREEETRKKRKGDEVKEEGKKKIKAEADSISQPAEEEKSSKDEVHHKLKKEKEESSRGKESKSLLASSDESKQNRVEELKKEQRRLHRDIKDFNKKRSNADDKAKVKPEEKDVEDNKDDSTEDDLLVMVKQERQKYKQQKKQLGRLGNREDATLAMLASFEKKLSAARTLAGDYDDVEEEKTVEDEEDDADDMSWMRHKLHFEEVAQKTKVIDANIPDSDRYALNDPRNPLNQRRRESSKRAMREKR